MEYLTMKDVAERLTVPYNVLRYHRNTDAWFRTLSTGGWSCSRWIDWQRLKRARDHLLQAKAGREIEQMVNLCEGKRGAK